MTTAPYEQATLEFRQVRHEVVSLVPDEKYYRSQQQVYYTVQQKWLVQNGEAYPVRWMTLPRCDTDVRVSEGATADSFPWYAPVRAEWRDLPEVSEEEASRSS